MPKKIIYTFTFALIIASFAGCSKPEPPFMPNLYSRAKAGDWARYSVVKTGTDNKNFTGNSKVTVVASSGGSVKIREYDETNDLAVQRPVDASGNMYETIFAALSKEVKDAKAAGFEGPIVETVTAAGRQFDCKRYVLKFTGKPPGGEALNLEFTETWWISENAPLDGMVRLKRVSSGAGFGAKGERTEERVLIEFGTAATAPKSETGAVPAPAATAPPTPAPAAQAVASNPLKNVKKGDWAEYDFKESFNSAGDGQTALIRREAIEVGEDSIKLSVSDGYSNREYGLTLSKTYDPVEDIKRQFTAEGTGIVLGNLSTTKETVQTAIEDGADFNPPPRKKPSIKNWDATLYILDFSGPAGAIQVRIWISPDAPLDGIVKKTIIVSRPAEPGSDTMEQMTQEMTLKAYGRSE